jgi:uncharacterized damage-inducible protein DinB
MEQIQWFDRKFDFSADASILPSVVERLTGTPVRICAKMKLIRPELFSIKPEGKWSMLEHIGHLSDLEPLWQGRINDILEGKIELRPTDLSNRKTDEANHHSKSLDGLVKRFQDLRDQTVFQVAQLKDEDIKKTALHPRLKTPMRIIDHLIFVAEHDDHHLASITELHRLLRAI